MKGFARPWNHIGSLTVPLLRLAFSALSKKPEYRFFGASGRKCGAMAEEKGEWRMQ